MAKSPDFSLPSGLYCNAPALPEVPLRTNNTTEDRLVGMRWAIELKNGLLASHLRVLCLKGWVRDGCAIVDQSSNSFVHNGMGSGCVCNCCSITV